MTTTGPYHSPSYDPTAGFPTVVPILLYRDPDAALAWLTTAFGADVRLRATDQRGTVHADLQLGTGVVMVERAPAGWSPPSPAGKAQNFVLVMVSDVDAHHGRAVAAGADVLHAPTDKPWGLRQYVAHDLEGHTWEFSQFVADVPVAQWGLANSDAGNVGR